jgi:predicted acylesterase/phospholipase RssA
METTTTISTRTTLIKHIVLSGGGPSGLLTYGAISHLAKEGFWQLENIKSIYGCSIGSFIGVIISLGYDWSWLHDYFIKRPWHKVFSINAFSFIEAFEKKGVFDKKIIEESLLPLLSAKDLNLEITLKELFAFNSIDIHLYTTNINTYHFEKVDMSHKTHPELKVVEALYRSMAYPFLFKPICIDDDCFIDGGLLNNYPLNDCIKQTQCNKDEIVAFKNIWVINDYKIGTQSSLFDFLIVIMKKMQREIDTEVDQEEVKNIVKCVMENLDGPEAWFNALSTEEMRTTFIEKGVAAAKTFLEHMVTSA